MAKCNNSPFLWTLHSALFMGTNFSVSPLAVGDGCTLCIFDFKRSTPSLPMSFLLKNSDTSSSCHSLGLYGPKLNKSILGNKLNTLNCLLHCPLHEMSTHWIMKCTKWITNCYIYSRLSPPEPSWFDRGHYWDCRLEHLSVSSFKKGSTGYSVSKRCILCLLILW